jgi:hypothetical protein
VSDIDVVIGLLIDVAAGVEVGVVSDTARCCAIGMETVDKVVSIIGVGGADWGSRWKRCLFWNGRRCFD